MEHLGLLGSTNPELSWLIHVVLSVILWRNTLDSLWLASNSKSVLVWYMTS